jgi:hypothetical protein
VSPAAFVTENVAVKLPVRVYRCFNVALFRGPEYTRVPSPKSKVALTEEVADAMKVVASLATAGIGETASVTAGGFD